MQGGAMNKRSFLRFVSIALFLFLSLAAIPVIAQEAGGGSISGSVKDEDGAALPGVLVTVAGEKGVRSVTTDIDGNFKINNLAAGSYDVKVELSGFTTIQQTDVKVESADVPQAFTMKPGSLQELMVVTASRVETPL